MLTCLAASGVPIAERRHGPGEVIYLRGDPDGGLRFLLEGTARVHKPYGGYKEATVRVLSGEGIFGEPSLMTPAGPHCDSAEASLSCRVATVPKAPLLDHLARDPGCRHSMVIALTEWAEQREAAVSRLLARGVGARLARALLELVGRFGRRTDGGLEVGVRLTHRDLAGMVASERASVSKEMSRFRREGLVEAPPEGRVRVLDERGLCEVAEAGTAGPASVADMLR
jgi:CRP-like cAMP-binding protein